MKDGAVLPTPLNIKEFALATNNKIQELWHKEELLEQIHLKSTDIAIGFSEEIKKTDDHSKLLLSLIFISQSFSIDTKKLSKVMQY